MIIDADTHINGRGTGAGVTMDESLRQMDALGVDKAITWPMVSYIREMAADNPAIAGRPPAPRPDHPLWRRQPPGAGSRQGRTEALHRASMACAASSSTARAMATTSTTPS